MPRRTCLALEPWFGGSHERFLAQWQRRSAFEVEIEGLAARAWKWRMRGGAWELARRVSLREGSPPDLVLASDMLDLPSFFGFAPPAWNALPSLVYFHENQLTYPSRPEAEERERDAHYGFTNVLSCVRADLAVFNSHFHRDAFANAARELCARLPAPNPLRELDRALERSRVVAPGVELDAIPLGSGGAPNAPLRVAFNHRWEHDKDPRAFLEAAREAIRRGARIELVLLGERFAGAPPGVGPLLDELEPQIAHAGFAVTREDYARLLGTCDLVVSTARHEFFGLAVCEALAAGCAPLLPRRLAYPELLPEALRAEGLYESEAELAERLARSAAEPARRRAPESRARWRRASTPFGADASAGQLDRSCEELVARKDRPRAPERRP